MLTKKYTVDRITQGKVVLLDRADEAIQVVVDQQDFAKVAEGDILQVTWSQEEGGPSYTVILTQETDHQRQKVTNLLEKLKNKPKK